MLWIDTTPAAASGTMIEVVMLDDCTATVMISPRVIATMPPPLPRTALSERSTRSATRRRMFFVIRVSATNTITRPVNTIRVPSTLVSAPNSL